MGNESRRRDVNKHGNLDRNGECARTGQQIASHGRASRTVRKTKPVLRATGFVRRLIKAPVCTE